MSIEAQFYEARRRQSAIERHQSLRTQMEMDKQAKKSAYQTLCIPIRVVRQDDKRVPCTCKPMRRTKLSNSDQSLYQRDRDIYPRSLPITNVRRHGRRAKLHNRFSSTDYLQQW